MHTIPEGHPDFVFPLFDERARALYKEQLHVVKQKQCCFVTSRMCTRAQGCRESEGVHWAGPLVAVVS